MQNIAGNLVEMLSRIAFPKVGIIDIIQIALIAFFVYQFMVWIKYTHAYTLLKGILVVLLFILVAYIFKMNTILWIFSNLASTLIVGVIVIFQPELRKVLEQLGQKKIMSALIPFDAGKEVKERFTDKTISELVKACFDMGEVKTGALIVIEQEEKLTDYIRTGINVDAILTSQLLINIFEHNTPLHDGAVIVRENRIVAATCYLPLSDNMELSKQLGTRHRAGVGISEQTDSVTIIVSEETGQVSVAQNGRLIRGVNSAKLREILVRAQNKQVVDNSKLRHLLKGRMKHEEEKTHCNLSLKIMSVAIAIVVWLIVVNIDNPVGTNYYTITDVELINKEYVESSDTIGKMCMPEENQDSVKVAITASKKVRDRIRLSDITAVADLQQAVSLDTDPVMVPITVTCLASGVLPSDIKVTPQNLTVNLDEKETQEFVVNVSKGDTKPGKDYEVGSLTASPEKIRITGPKTLVNKIDKVNATIALDGNTEDYTQEVNLTIYDKNQEALSESEMNSLRIENNAKVIVTAKLWKIRTGVKIAAGYVGTPAGGYQVGSVKTVPDTISVAGNTEGLESLSENDNVITIPADRIDISGESKDVERKISLKNLLPDNVKLTSDSSEDVWVTVSILPVGSQEFNLPTKNIEVKNKPDNLQVTFETAQIALRIKSESENLADLNIDEDVKAEIDLKDKEAGNYKVPVKLSLPDGYEMVEDVYTEVVISPASVSDESK